MCFQKIFKNTELDRVSFKDYKNFFAIQVDDSRLKKIAVLKYKSRKPIIQINDKEIEIAEVSVAEITKHKNAIVNSGLSNLL